MFLDVPEAAGFEGMETERQSGQQKLECFPSSSRLLRRHTMIRVAVVVVVGLVRHQHFRLCANVDLW